MWLGQWRVCASPAGTGALRGFPSQRSSGRHRNALGQVNAFQLSCDHTKCKGDISIQCALCWRPFAFYSFCLRLWSLKGMAEGDRASYMTYTKTCLIVVRLVWFFSNSLNESPDLRLCFFKLPLFFFFFFPRPQGFPWAPLIVFSKYHIFRCNVHITFLFKAGAVQVFVFPKSNTLATF